jgi:uncharacterized cupin superfamily protein
MTEYALPAGVNRVITATTAVIDLEAVEADDVENGSPTQGTIELGEIGGCEAGIWELRAGTVTDTEVDELFVVLSGSAVIELIDDGRRVEVHTGDVMRLVAGTRTRWIVADHIRKVYLAG